MTKKIKLMHTNYRMAVMGLCDIEMLTKRGDLRYLHGCETHVIRLIQLPECIECMCQSMEMLYVPPSNL